MHISPVLWQFLVKWLNASALFPREASTIAPYADALYFFLLLITVVGLELGTLVGGVVIVEQVFGWSGLGWLALQAINDKDYPVLQGVILLFALGVAIASLLADLAYACADPRIRAALR